MQPESENEPKKRLTEALRIRLRKTERDAVDATALAAGVGPCTWARLVVVAAVGQTPTPAPRRRRRPSPAARDLADVIGALARIGNNLNQLARSVNSGFDLDSEIVKEATNELRQLREAIIAPRADDASR